ncbi:glycoside hydrolase [bacterium]|nr:glycoside hydrolase [bacterium]
MSNLILTRAFALSLALSSTLLSGCTVQLIRQITANAKCNAMTALSVTNVTGTSTLWSGESVAFSLSGGCPAYTASDQGSGYLNPNTYVYTVPLPTLGNSVTPLSETLQFSDKSGTTLDVPLTVRSFQSQTPSFATATSTFSPSFYSMVEAGGILYGGTTRVFGYNPLVVSSASLYRSTDGGTTWTLIDDFMITPGSQAQINALAARGTRMAMLVAGGTGTFSGYVVRFSQDSGATWSTIYTALDGTYNHHGTDIKFYDNDTLIITGSRSSTTTSYEDWVIKRCVISSQTCADVEVVTSTSNINNQSQRVAVDGAGVIYVAGQQATGASFF